MYQLVATDLFEFAARSDDICSHARSAFAQRSRHGWTDGRTHGRADRRTHGHTHGHMHAHTHARADGQTDGNTHAQGRCRMVQGARGTRFVRRNVAGHTENVTNRDARTNML